MKAPDGIGPEVAVVDVATAVMVGKASRSVMLAVILAVDDKSADKLIRVLVSSTAMDDNASVGTLTVLLLGASIRDDNGASGA